MATGAWEEYYRGGWLVSLPLGGREGYDGELLQQWRDFFGTVAPGSRIVDLCTGNGAVALIARDVALARRVSLDIHGIDAAAIDPPRWVPDGARRFEGIRFHGNVASDSLPFEDASVQAISGQFALEYTDVPATLTEIARVLEPAGRARFIVHRADSPVTDRARETLEQGQLIFRHLRVFDHLRHFIEAEKLEPRRAPALHRRLNDVGSDVQRAAASAQYPQFLQGVLAALSQIFEARRRISTSDLLRSVDQSEKSLKTTLQLLEELAAVTRTREQMGAIADLAAERFEVELTNQRQGQADQFAWRFDLQRRPVRADAGV